MDTSDSSSVSKLAVKSAVESGAVVATVTGNKRGKKPLAHPTAREREILAGLYYGGTNREVGAALGLSHDTIRRHVFNLSRFMGHQSRTRLVTYALEKGWIDLRPVSAVMGKPTTKRRLK